MGAARGKSALLVAKEGGKVVGCGGLETRVIREGLVTKYEVVKRGDPPGTSLGPVLANLAVDRTLRRKGVGKKILMECERVVKGWGFQVGPGEKERRLNGTGRRAVEVEN